MGNFESSESNIVHEKEFKYLQDSKNILYGEISLFQKKNSGQLFALI